MDKKQTNKKSCFIIQMIRYKQIVFNFTCVKFALFACLVGCGYFLWLNSFLFCK